MHDTAAAKLEKKPNLPACLNCLKPLWEELL